jgi:hypothetical protein
LIDIDKTKKDSNGKLIVPEDQKKPFQNRGENYNDYIIRSEKISQGIYSPLPYITKPYWFSEFAKNSKESGFSFKYCNKLSAATSCLYCTKGESVDRPYGT